MGVVQSQRASFEPTLQPRVSWAARVLLGAHTPSQVRATLTAYAFLSPWIIGLIVFFGGPIIASLVLSFFDYSLVKSPEFVGLANFKMAMSGDPLFWPSLLRTFYWTLIYVPIVVVGSLFLDRKSVV